MTSWPSSKYERIWWVLTWPINLVLLVTIPDCRRSKLRSWYPLTFIMCIIWIASTSYIVGWVITIIGRYFFFLCFFLFFRLPHLIIKTDRFINKNTYTRIHTYITWKVIHSIFLTRSWDWLSSLLEWAYLKLYLALS